MVIEIGIHCWDITLSCSKPVLVTMAAGRLSVVEIPLELIPTFGPPPLETYAGEKTIPPQK